MSDTTPHRISILRVGAAGGVGLPGLMVLCRIGAFIPSSNPTHAYGLASNSNGVSGNHMTKPRPQSLLVVDDEPAIANFLAEVAKDAGWKGLYRQYH